MPDGSLRLIDRGMLEILGIWTKLNDEALHLPAPTGIAVEDHEEEFLLRHENTLYLFAKDIPDCHSTEPRFLRFQLEEPIASVCWLDNGEELPFTQEEGAVSITAIPQVYGVDLVLRIAKITLA